MKISEAFSGNYLKAADIPHPITMTMTTVTQEKMPDESTKPVVKFANENRGLTLNKINATTIAALYGDDTAGWNGRQIELFSTTTFFNGRQVPCIRVRAPQAQPVAVPTQQGLPQQQVAPPQPPVQQPAVAAPQMPQPPVTAPQQEQVPFDA